VNYNFVYDNCLKIAARHVKDVRTMEGIAQNMADKWKKGQLNRATDVFIEAEKLAKRQGK